jgi:hypothetical protein
LQITSPIQQRSAAVPTTSSQPCSTGRKVTIGGRYTFDTVEKVHSALEDRRMIGKPLLIIAAH